MRGEEEMGPMEGRVILCFQVLALEVTQLLPCNLNAHLPILTY